MHSDYYTRCKPVSSTMSAKKAKHCEVIYVYCPEKHIKTLKESISDSGFEVVLNDFGLTDFSDKVICHYESSELDLTQKQFLVKAMEFGAWVEPLVNYLDSRLGYAEVALLRSSYFLHQKAFSILSTKQTQIAKRVMDIFISAILLFVTSPILVVTSLLIKVDSKGPILYRQARVGQFNREYQVIKFRSMRSDAERNGAQWAKENDDRVTRVGKFIRKTRIDELPQLINVLKGEMSIVGPRPEREVFIKELEKEIPYYRFRHAVKPGITGLAQVSYPYGASLTDAIWKHKFDVHYIKHHSTFTDLSILIKTIKVVLLGMGR